MSRAIALLATLVGVGLSAPATAAEVGWLANLELAHVGNSDPYWDLFSNGPGMPSRGIRGGVRVGDHVAALAGWHRVRRGADIDVPVLTGRDVDFQTVRMAFFADEYTLGARVGAPVVDVIYPYVSGDGMVLRTVVKFDEDIETRENPGQVQGSGWAPGALALGGLELRTRQSPIGLRYAGFLELGYGWFLPGQLGDIGQMQPGGLVVRGGVGVRR